jgi:hypothetical protein
MDISPKNDFVAAEIYYCCIIILLVPGEGPETGPALVSKSQTMTNGKQNPHAEARAG